jgi:hypothetical protein
MKTSIFDKLNLRPQERRLVVIVGMVLFVLINWWFVWPFFWEWGKVQNDLRKDASTLTKYNNEIAKRGQYERKQRDLEQTGSEMLNNETDFQRIVSSQAASAGVYVSDLRTGGGGGFGSKTNQFFQEQSISVQFSSGGREIVDFLVGIAAQNAMIRVREMNIRPDSVGQKLQGSIVFVGNYARQQTNAPTARAAARAAATATGTKSGAQPGTQAAKPPTNQAASKKMEKPAATTPEKKK